METRSFVFGAAAGAIITAIAFAAFRSNSTSALFAKPDTAMDRETPKVRTETSLLREPEMPAYAAVAESGNPPVPQPPGLSPQNDAKEPPRHDTTEGLVKRLQAEARDESWAPGAEIALGDYLARQPYPDALGSPTINCQSTLCLVTTIVDAAVLQAAPSADLQAAMGNMQYESLGRELVPLHVGKTNIAELPDRVLMWAMVQRVEPPAQPKP